MKKEFNKIENKMDYAMRLTDLTIRYEGEELFKLACLCKEIEELKQSGEKADREIEKEFLEKAKEFYKKCGTFRSEVDRHPKAKRFFQSL
jgi:hypothetical protein